MPLDELLRRMASDWGTYYEADHVEALLNALARRGYVSALPYVRQVAGQGARAAGQKRVQAAARACVVALEALVMRGQEPDQLLRASREPDPRPDVLLRPASGPGGENAEELLRGSQENEREE
jgi:hypothetical protein